MNQDSSNQQAFYYTQFDITTTEYLKNCVKRSTKKLKRNLIKPAFYKNYFLKRLPIIQWLFMEYSFKKFLLNDLVSGFTVGIMNIPQSMAYALLANLAPVNGLYISFFPKIMYALFGTSRHLAIGAIAVVSLLTGEVVLKMGNEYKDSLVAQNLTSNTTDHLVYNYKVTVACSLAFFVGIFQILMGFTGLGIVTKYFSDSFIGAYMCGSAFHVLTSQIKDLLGLKNLTIYSGPFKIPRTLFNMAFKVKTTNICTLISSAGCFLFLMIFKEFLNPRIKKIIKIEFPSELLLVIGMTLISRFGNLNKIYGLNIIETIPRGLPQPSIPNFTLWGNLIKNALIISLVSFSVNISIGTLLSRKHNYKIDSTQELYAYGVSNIFGSFFACFPSSASLSRSMVLDNTGSKSQLAPLTSACIILIVIIWLGPFFEPLPKVVLAVIIVYALKSLFLQQSKYFVSLWNINKYEFACWIGSFLSVVLLDIDIGLYIGIGLSIFLIVARDQNADLILLEKIDSSFVDSRFIKKTDTYPNEQDNIKVIKVQNSLYFVNISSFIKEFKKIAHLDSDVTRDYSIIKSEEVSTSVSYFLFDFSAVNYIDTSAVKALLQVSLFNVYIAGQIG